MEAGTIFPQDGKWFFVVKSYKNTVKLRELLNYKIGSSKLNFGGSYTANKTKNG